MPNKNKRPVPKKPSPQLFPRGNTTPLAVKRSCEFWLDIFTTTISDLLANEENVRYHITSGSPIMCLPLVADARSIADAALCEFEDRWPGILIP